MFSRVALGRNKSIEKTLADKKSLLALKKKQRKKIEQKSYEKITEGQRLLFLARSKGLTDYESEGEDLNETMRILNEIVVKFEQTTEKDMLIPFKEANLSQLDQAIKKLNKEIKDIDEEITEANIFNKTSQDYSNGISEQVSRLKSIELFTQTDLFYDAKQCPLCFSALAQPIPEVSAIKSNLEKLEDELRHEKSIKPKLDNHLKKLEEKREALKKQRNEKKAIYKKALEEIQPHQVIPTADRENLKFIGVIEEFLRKVQKKDDVLFLKSEEEVLQQQIKRLEDRLDKEQIKNTADGVFFRINQLMTAWAEELQLEDAGASYHLNPEKLIVVVTNKNGQSKEMTHLRAHADWVGCHLITFLALHFVFIELDSFSPGFLILDQPTTGFDNKVVQRVFDLFSEICNREELASRFQIIVMDHINLTDNTSFQNALVEDYWTGEEGGGLIPRTWLV